VAKKNKGNSPTIKDVSYKLSDAWNGSRVVINDELAPLKKDALVGTVVGASVIKADNALTDVDVAESAFFDIRLDQGSYLIRPFTKLTWRRREFCEFCNEDASGILDFWVTPDNINRRVCLHCQDEWLRLDPRIAWFSLFLMGWVPDARL